MRDFVAQAHTSAQTSDAASETVKTLPQTQFGKGAAESYLVDTLNELNDPKVTAKCMAMISKARAFCSELRFAWAHGFMSTKSVLATVRMRRAEKRRSDREQTLELDEELAAWMPVLTDTAYVKAALRARALKLAMNISTAAFRRLNEDGVIVLKSDREPRELAPVTPLGF